MKRLVKLASISAGLREAVEKRAFVGKALTALSAVSAAGGAVGKTKQFKTGFDPAAQQAALGKSPGQE